MKNLLPILALILVSTSLVAQTNRTLTIKVTNIESEKGTIRIALFDSEASFLKEPFKALSKVPSGDEITFAFTDISNGNYTISVYHDLNNNGELDTYFMGIPSEPYGISMDGKSNFGPPNYENAVFMINGEDVELTIEL